MTAPMPARRQSGRWVVIAAVSLASALTIRLSATPILLAMAERTGAEATEVLARRAAAPVEHPASADAAMALAAALPADHALPDRIAVLLQLPARHGLQGGRIEASPPTAVMRGVTQIRIVQTLHGPYGAIRHSLEGALSADPALALAELRIVRAGPDAGDADAELVWLLFSSGGPTPSAP